MILIIHQGIYLAFGVFHAYYASSNLFSSTSNSAWIGVLGSGVPFLGAPLMVYICTHTSWPHIHWVWTGWLLGVISHLGAAYSHTIPSLIVNQGLLYGVSILLVDQAILLVVNTWFVTKRGIAYGIIFGMSDVCAIGWSFLAQWLLNTFGLKATFVVFALVMFALPGPCLLLLRERMSTSIWKRAPKPAASPDGRAVPTYDVPCSPTLAKTRSHSYSKASTCAGVTVTTSSVTLKDETTTTITSTTNVSSTTQHVQPRFYRRPIFYLLTLSNFFQALAFYLPIIYLPTYITSLSTSSSSSRSAATTNPAAPTTATHISLLNASQIAGELLFGYLSDILSAPLLALISSTSACLATFLLWGFSGTEADPKLYAFAILFGFSGAGYLALWARMGMLFGEKDAQVVFGTLCAGRGLGSLVSGPVSEGVLRLGTGGGVGGRGWAGVAGGRWRGLIVLVGGCMAASAVLAGAGWVVAGVEGGEVRGLREWVWAEGWGVATGENGVGDRQAEKDQGKWWWQSLRRERSSS